MSGYADDVALFLRGPEDEVSFLKILVEFEAASGLALNRDKCVVVCLHPDGPQPCHNSMQISPISKAQATRYLDVPVSCTSGYDAAWTATCRAIRVRTIIALHKTVDVLQRCRLAAAIIVPNILYVARHIWPTATTVEMLDKAMHTFGWTDVFVHESTHSRRALHNRHHSQLHLNEGGVGEPDLWSGLRAMATTTIATWACGQAAETQAIGDVLLWS